MKKIMVVLLVSCLVQACSSKAPELKSPCVGKDGSPCEHKKINNLRLYS